MRLLTQINDELNEKFIPKKKNSKKLSKVYKRIGLEKRAKICGSCADTIEYNVFDDGTARLNKVFFCKDMLCPLCTWRKELKLFNQVSKIVDVLQNQKYRFLFVTLTMKNCAATSESLKEALDDLNEAYTRLIRLNRIKKILKGAYRAIEVTYNEKTNEFHPHIHLIWVVPADYFQCDDYLKQNELCELWKQSLGVDYTPICDIRVVCGKKVKKNGKIIAHDLKSAVAEVCKYAIKSTDYLKHDDVTNDRIVSALVEALSHRRLVSFYGVFSEIRRQLNLDKDEDDLVHVSNEQSDANVMYTMFFKWNNKLCEYVHTNVIVNLDIRVEPEEQRLTG